MYYMPTTFFCRFLLTEREDAVRLCRDALFLVLQQVKTAVFQGSAISIDCSETSHTLLLHLAEGTLMYKSQPIDPSSLGLKGSCTGHRRMGTR